MALKTAYIQFLNSSDIYAGINTFYFQNAPSTGSFQWATGKRGNLSISRTVNKNLIQSQLPVNTYYDGGLCVDIGMCDDTFSIDLETYSWDEYRLLASLVKCNTGMQSGTFHYGEDEFAVAVRNVSFSMPSGKDDYVKIQIALTVINTRFAT